MAEPFVLAVGKSDNVVVAIRPLPPGTNVEVGADRRVVVIEPIPFGHKLATTAIEAGEAVIKYDETIGVASARIPAGAHVHVHNVVSARLPGGGDVGPAKATAR